MKYGIRVKKNSILLPERIQSVCVCVCSGGGGGGGWVGMELQQESLSAGLVELN